METWLILIKFAAYIYLPIVIELLIAIIMSILGILLLADEGTLR
jgi:hypothetical protein